MSRRENPVVSVSDILGNARNFAGFHGALACLIFAFHEVPLFMALVECKECGAKISDNAATCPNCGDIIKEPKPPFSLLDAIHKISIPVILSIAGTMITILTFLVRKKNEKWSRRESFWPTRSTKTRSSSSIAFPMWIHYHPIGAQNSSRDRELKRVYARLSADWV